MEYRQLGRSGVRVSCLCLGAMNFGGRTDEPTSIRIIDEALEAGINFIDTADVYGRGASEEIVGKALAQNHRRDEIVLATKAVASMGEGPNDHGASRYHLVRACEQSLRRLRTDRIDLFQLHIVDFTTPMDEILETLGTLVRQGKVCYVGTSKHPISLIVEGIALSERYGWPRFISEQPPYHLLDRSIENELVWTCQRHGIGLIPWGPLASGILSGRYRLGEPGPADTRFAGKEGSPEEARFNTASLECVEKFRLLAEAKGVTLAQFALAWNMQQPGITAPIMGPRILDHLHAGLKAAEVEITPADRAAVDAIVPPGSWVSNFYPMNVYQRLHREVGLTPN